jgi:GTP1/Obg family GTP-binding protein
MFGETTRLRAKVANLIEKLDAEQGRSFRYCQRISELEELLHRSAGMMADYRVQLLSAMERIGKVRAAVADVPLVNTEDKPCRG